MAEKKVTFEKAIHDLESIVDKLESGDLSLDNALEYFEQGVGLMRFCDAHLRSAEGKIKELLEGENGEFIEKELGLTSESIIGGDEDDE